MSGPLDEIRVVEFAGIGPGSRRCLRWRLSATTAVGAPVLRRPTHAYAHPRTASGSADEQGR